MCAASSFTLDLVRRRNNPTSYLQGVEVAACVMFHIKVMDGELDTTPWGPADVPDTLLVVGIVERVPRAAEGACDSRHLPTTACWTQKKKTSVNANWQQWPGHI